MKLLPVLLTLVAVFFKWGDAFAPSSSLWTSTKQLKVLRGSCAAKQIRGHGAPSISLNPSLLGKKSSSSILFSQPERGVEPARDTSDKKSITDDKKSITDVLNALQSNLEDGELGSRGESYFILQLALISCILFGSVPFIDNVLNIVLGPGFVLLGGSVLSIGVAELGTNLTPWPSPPKNGSLVTEGIVFNEIRHPIYAGLIFLMFGLSMWSGSAMRVLLCVLLWYLLDFKSDLEEDELVKKFGIDYIEYRERVQGKFIPGRLTEGIENTATKMGRSAKQGGSDD